MACGCGRGGPARQSLRVRSVSQDGEFKALATYPECSTRYSGRHAGNSVLVVARGNAELERIFTRQQLGEAYVYSRDQQVDAPEPIPTVDLCADAVVALLG